MSDKEYFKFPEEPTEDERLRVRRLNDVFSLHDEWAESSEVKEPLSSLMDADIREAIINYAVGHAHRPVLMLGNDTFYKIYGAAFAEGARKWDEYLKLKRLEGDKGCLID